MDNDHQCLPCRWHQSTARWGGVNDAACSGGISESEKRLCFPDTDIIGYLASLVIERGAFVSGCGGSRTRPRPP